MWGLIAAVVAGGFSYYQSSSQADSLSSAQRSQAKINAVMRGRTLTMEKNVTTALIVAGATGLAIYGIHAALK